MSDVYNYSIYVICALAGNAWRESHVNPTLHQQNGSAFGMFQWDGERRENLKAWLTQNNYSITDPYGQMEYLVIENDWIGTYAGISSLQEFLNSPSTNIEELTTAFCNCWERPALPELEERIYFANRAYNYIIAHMNDQLIISWNTQPMYYLSEEQGLHNTVLMYRFYSSGVFPPIRRKKKMPVWMMVRRFR